MHRPNHLIIFARQPHYGVGKTRLANRTSKWEAWQFQRRQILSLCKLAQDPRWSFSFCWEHRQGPGDLGTRISRALGGTHGQKRLIVGGDTLGLTALHIDHAFELIGARSPVLGPSQDGGFWCIGSAGPIRLTGIRWSSEHTLSDTSKLLKNHKYTNTLCDLD